MVRMEELTSTNAINLTTRESGTHSEEKSKDGGNVQEEIEKEQLDASTLFQGLTAQDLSSEESNSETATEAIDWEGLQTQMENNGSSLESIERMQVWIEGWRRLNGQGDTKTAKTIEATGLTTTTRSRAIGTKKCAVHKTKPV